MPKIVFLLFFFLFLSFLSFAQEQELPYTSVLTVQQYAEFLQATAATDTYNLYNEKMGEDSSSRCIVRHGDPGSYTYEAIPERANDPVPYVSRLSAKRYCNWLQNGQPTGEQDETTTEEGAYTLDGTMEADSAKEGTANYFLPASTNNQIDLTLSSNLKSYIIVAHFGDSFNFGSALSSESEDELIAVKTIEGVLGIAFLIGAVGTCSYCGHVTPDYEEEGIPAYTPEQRTVFNRMLAEEGERTVPLEPHYDIANTSSLIARASETTTTATESSTPSEQVSPEQSALYSSLKVMTSPPDRLSPLLQESTSSKKSGNSKPPKQCRFAESLEPTHYLHCYVEEETLDPAKLITPSHAIAEEEFSETPLATLQARQRAKLKNLQKKGVNHIAFWIKHSEELYGTSVKNFFETLKTNVEFFYEKTQEMTPEKIAELKASNPSFFQDPSHPCWNNEEELRTFVNILKGENLENYYAINPNELKNIISKYTVLFEASEAIDSWKQEIQATQGQLLNLSRRLTSQLPSPSNGLQKDQVCHFKKEFATLAQITFDHLLDFQDYIDELIANSTRPYDTTRSLTPNGMLELRKEKEALDEWLNNWDESTASDSSSSASAALSGNPTTVVQHVSTLKKILYTLSLLSRHNLGEALRFDDFRKRREAAKRNQVVITTATEAVNKLFIQTEEPSHLDYSNSTQGHTDSGSLVSTSSQDADE